MAGTFAGKAFGGGGKTGVVCVRVGKMLY